VPAVEQQFAAVLGAPLPFFLALFAVLVPVCIFIWRAMEWRYRGIIDATQTMHELARKQHQVATDNEVRLQATLADWKATIEELKTVNKTDPQNSERVNRLIMNVSEAANIASKQLDNLSTANNAVSDALFVRPIGDRQESREETRRKLERLQQLRERMGLPRTMPPPD
jgi:ribonuclease HI